MLKGEHYCISAKNLLCHEFIGLNAVVEQSTDESRKGMQGMIIDETKNVFVIRTKRGDKKVPKSEAVFGVMLGDQKVLVDGKKITVRPFDRVKYFWRRH